MIGSNQITTVCNTSNKIPFSRKLLASGITSILLASAGFTLIAPSAFAQTSAEVSEDQVTTVNKNTTKASKDKDIEELEVTGIRFSQRSALDRKKAAVTMTDSLVAEDIGAFPDKNIAEALQRIPGVQISRDNGEGSSVSVRGVDPDLLRVELNSVGVMGMGGSRGVDFRDMASELVKSLDVIKGSEARLTEGGIGGTIQVNTRKPNEFESDFFSVDAEAQYNDLIGDTMPKINLIGVHKFHEKLGVLVNVTASDKTTVLHGVRNTEWARFADYDGAAEKTSVNPIYADITEQSGCSGISVVADRNTCLAQWQEYVPYLPRYGIWERGEERVSANAMVQYAFTDNFSAHLGYTYNERDKSAYDINMQFETNSAARINPSTVVVDDRHNVVGFKTANASVSNRVLDIDWDQETSMLEAGFEYTQDKFQALGVIARSTSKQDIDSRGTTVWAGGIVDMEVTLNREGLPNIDLSNAYILNAADPSDTSYKFDMNDPASYTGGASYNYRPVTDETEEDMAKVDFAYNPDAGFFTKFQTGYQYNTQNFSNANYAYNIIRNVGANYNGQVWTIADQVNLIEGRTESTPTFFNHFDLDVYAPSTWQAIDSKAILEELRAISADNTTRNDLNVSRGNFDVDVETNAIYGQANFEMAIGSMPLKGNMGVRVVDTNTSANGDVTIRVWVDQLDENGNPVINPVTGAYAAPIEDLDHPDTYNGRKTIDEGYTETLPSLNLTLGLIPDELELFFGAAKVMAHPRIADINVNATCVINDYTQAQIDDLPNTCTAGNPALKPYVANQLDLALTWYPNDDSIVSAAFFSKEMESWIVDPDTQYDVDFLNDGRVWDVRQKYNSSGAKTEGVELQASTIFSMLPAPFDGFGGSVNYTYMKAEDVGLFNQISGEELPFPSQSEDSYNLTAFYETEVWGIRVAYNYRSEYLVRASDRSGNPLFVSDAGYLDAKFNYNITDNLKFHIDGRNLTQETLHLNSGEGRMAQYDYSGREFAIGIMYKM
ncbi:TonB-dependent receptor [Cellvibrio sp. NN19]|uniref:TonB-dependent receptor n=1 Tax=Cellvibrio chitinivorans TaxID=3102792 RepID=UPI002B415179|nr:TonB-dependent receptor [Cellvibrio sp. NN19]